MIDNAVIHDVMKKVEFLSSFERVNYGDVELISPAGNGFLAEHVLLSLV